ncbi:pantothenate transporter liz1 [Plectosphaerella plurivora]|uniref:Pantothenate transporter liz1 n=1 Tax=Plectosphaerella plurivora TaxID=936078 RepID=A0A9P9ACT8_9PEZI|nr:pantothenate transporter liz1 [Plectosphaerella plurivora]
MSAAIDSKAPLPSGADTPPVADTKNVAASVTSADGTHTPSDSASQLILEKPVKTWRSYIWDTLDKSPAERKFLFKLDAILLTMASLGYFIKYLDQVNINNAYVSGMREDLGLFGNELNYIQTAWTVGYVLGEIPSNLLLTRIRPSIWIPACELTWSVLTILLAKCKNSTQLLVLRFFIGLAESVFYPGMQYIIGSWYRGDELAKRSCIFHVSGAIGSMFSGYLMAGAINLDGIHGYHGWQWLFIINTIISLPISIAGFFLMPDLPEITKAWYFTKDDIAMAKKRMELEGRANRAPFTKAKILKIFKSWHIYLLTALYVFFNNGCGGMAQPGFQLWLKGEGYSLKDVNTYPTLTSAVAIVTTLIYAWTSDTVFRGARWPPIVFSGLVNIFVYASLTVWNIPDGLKWASFIMAGFGGGISGLTFAWAHEICKDDNEERALVTGSMNEIAYVFQAWLPLLIWKVSEAPSYPKGNATMVGIAVALIGTAFSIRYLHARELKQKAVLRPTVV